MMPSQHNELGCEQILPHLEPYFDGQISGATQIEKIERHLARCPDCAARVKAMRAVADQVCALPKPEAPSYLRQRIETMAMTEAGVGTNRRAWGSSWFHRSLAIAAVAACLALFLTFKYGSPSALAHEKFYAYAENHIVPAVQNLNGAVLVSQDAGELEQWFSSNLGFSPRLPKWDWAEPIKGQLGYMRGQRVARVQYDAGGEEMTLFIQLVAPGPNPHEKATSPATAIVCVCRGFKIKCWSDGGLEYLVVAKDSAKMIFENLGKSESA